MNVTLLGIPIDLGAENAGVDRGPDAYRKQGIIEKLTHAGFTITDVGNIDCCSKNTLSIGDPKLKYLEEILRICELTAARVAESVKQGEKVVALGGDHSLCLGTISGASVAVEGDLGVI